MSAGRHVHLAAWAAMVLAGLLLLGFHQVVIGGIHRAHRLHEAVAQSTQCDQEADAAARSLCRSRVQAPVAPSVTDDTDG